MTPRGLITLERARLLDGDVDARPARRRRGQADRLRRPAAAASTARPAYHAVCDLLHRHGFAGASVFLGVDGTAHGERRRARFFSRNVDVPMMIIAVGTAEQVPAVAARAGGAAAASRWSPSSASRCANATGGCWLAPPALPATDDQRPRRCGRS